MKKILFWIILVLMSTSCECEQLALTQEEKNWIPYKEGQLLIFRSDLNTIDTLLVSGRAEGFTNPECNFSVSTKQRQYIRVALLHRSGKRTLLGSEIAIDKDYDGKISYPSIDIFGLKKEIQFQLKSYKVRLSNNRVYDHVHIIEAGVNARNIEDGYLKKFYYDHKEGLIKYVSKDDEIFELL